MASNILTVCDALVTAIDTAWTTKVADSGATSREYIAPVSAQELSSLTGRKVYVIPGNYDSAIENRGEDLWTYEVGILVIERYTTAGEPTRAWLDARVEFVENIVQNACDYPRTPLSISTREIRTQSIATVTYDIEMLNGSNLFWSEMQLVLSELLAI